MSNLFTNQFAQSVVVGDLDLSIMQSGKLAGILSPNQATPGVTVVASVPAKIDTAITTGPGQAINFLQASNTEEAIGFFARTSKQSTFAKLDVVEVAGLFGPVMWMLCAATITPGATVYNADSTGLTITTTAASNKQRGISLDYGLVNQIVRVMIINPVTINAA